MIISLDLVSFYVPAADKAAMPKRAVLAGPPLQAGIGQLLFQLRGHCREGAVFTV